MLSTEWPRIYLSPLSRHHGNDLPPICLPIQFVKSMQSGEGQWRRAHLDSTAFDKGHRKP